MKTVSLIFAASLAASLTFAQQIAPNPPPSGPAGLPPSPGQPERPRPEGGRPRDDNARPREVREPGRARVERSRRVEEHHGESLENRPPPPLRSGNLERGGFTRHHEAHSRLPEKLQPYLGIVTRNAPPELTAQIRQPEGFGLIVEDVLPETPASAAGLQKNDLLLRFEDQLLAHPIQLEALIRRAGKDKDVALTILRAGAEQKVTVKIGEKMLPERRPLPPLGFGNRERGPGFGAASRERGPDSGDSGEQRTVYAHEQARVVRRDNQGLYELTRKEGKRNFVAKDLEGKVTWQGPVDSPQEKEAIPAELRGKLQMLEEAQAPQGGPGGRGIHPLPVQ